MKSSENLLGWLAQVRLGKEGESGFVGVGLGWGVRNSEGL